MCTLFQRYQTINLGNISCSRFPVSRIKPTDSIYDSQINWQSVAANFLNLYYCTDSFCLTKIFFYGNYPVILEHAGRFVIEKF